VKAITRFLQALKYDFRRSKKGKESLAIEKASSKMQTFHVHHKMSDLVYKDKRLFV